MLNPTLHRIPIGNTVQQNQHLDQESDTILRCRAPSDAGMLCARVVKCQKIGIERNHHPLLSRRKGQLISIGQATMAGFLRRKHVDGVLAKTIGDRSGDMLVKVVTDWLGHPVFP
jgi:hypothetical protein